MRAILIKLAAISIMSCAAVFNVNAQQGELPLTNGSVVKLVRAGFKEKTVIAIIHNRPGRFNLDPDRLIELKRNGVSENIILAMLAQSASFVMADDDWTSDSAFRGDNGSGNGNSKSDGGSDIFGSSSGSHSQNSGRGMSGGNDGETTTTGSATVRILRPPTEAGAAPMKLEKSPTLTNEAVIKLVEAGFSEGTIIKRIEDSPAEFDLSATKLEELRRRRVTEAIIIAMTAAMGEDGDSKQGSPNGSRTRTKGN
ncbi:MAG TPA: hypothetical protein VK208_11680 [Pyrinomonadaceae bacterium]|jgi:hypothetical protein|nr:hypothetical protein [Pyrinomonadaceae bacterium]